MDNKVMQLIGVDLEKFKSIIREETNKVLEENKELFCSKTEKDSDCFLTRKEASEFLKISETKLYYLDKEQILPARRLGGNVLYLKSDLLNAPKIHN